MLECDSGAAAKGEGPPRDHFHCLLDSLVSRAGRRFVSSLINAIWLAAVDDVLLHKADFKVGAVSVIAQVSGDRIVPINSPSRSRVGW